MGYEPAAFPNERRLLPTEHPDGGVDPLKQRRFADFDLGPATVKRLRLVKDELRGFVEAAAAPSPAAALRLGRL